MHAPPPFQGAGINAVGQAAAPGARVEHGPAGQPTELCYLRRAKLSPIGERLDAIGPSPFGEHCNRQEEWQRIANPTPVTVILQGGKALDQGVPAKSKRQVRRELEGHR